MNSKLAYLFIFIFGFSFSPLLMGQLDCDHPQNHVIPCPTGIAAVEICGSTVGRTNTTSSYQCGTNNPINNMIGGEDLTFLNAITYNSAGFAEPVSVTITLSDFQGDLDLFLVLSCTNFNDCFDSSIGTGATETITFTHDFNQEAVIVVDGWNGDESDYTLTIEAHPVNIPNASALNGICQELVGHEGTYCESDFPSTYILPAYFFDGYSGTQSYRCANDATYYGLAAQSHIYAIEHGGGDITVTLSNAAFPLHTFIYTETLESLCPNSQSFDYFCQAHGTDTSPAIAQNVPAGRYYIIVDGEGFDETQYTIHVDYSDANCVGLDCECTSYINTTASPIVCDGFENYPPNSNTNNMGSPWSTYSGGNSATVSDIFSYLGNQDLRFAGGNTASDAVLDLGYYSSGKFRLEWHTYMAMGSFGSFGILYDYFPNNTNNNDWAFYCSLNGNGTGQVFMGNSFTSPLASFNYPQSQWFYVVLVIDIDTDKVEMWINEEFAAEWDYSNGAPVGGPTLDALNIWNPGNSAAPFHIDALCFRQPDCSNIFCSIEYDPVCVNGETFFNGCEASCAGYTEHEWTSGACENEPCPPTPCPNYITYDCPDLHFEYEGNVNNGDLTYAFTNNGFDGQDEFCSWEIYSGTDPNGEAIAISTDFTYNYTFAVSGFYTVCYAWWDWSEGCLKKCCKTIYVAPPLECGNDNIAYEYISGQNGYQFSLPANFINVSWIDDDNNGSSLGTGNTSDIVSVSGTCSVRTISVQYQDPNTGCWYICCLRYWLCNPTVCGQSQIDIQDNGNDNFTLNVSNNFSDIIWYVNESPIGGGSAVSQTFSPGSTYHICVYYFDFSSGCWFVCCRNFTLDDCDLPTANYAYAVNELQVNFTNNSTSTEGNPTYQWSFGDGSTSNQVNPTYTYGQAGTYTCCLVVSDDCGNSVVYCQEVMVNATPGDNLLFYLGENICGNSGSLVEVPVQVKNFNSITNFQFSISTTNQAIAQIEGISQINSELGNIFTDFNNPSGVPFSWDDPLVEGITLEDDEIIFVVLVSLAGNIGESTNIQFTNTPTNISAGGYINGNIMDLQPATENGSVCISQNLLNISGDIFRIKNGNEEAVHSVDVSLSQNGQVINTNEVNGSYDFSMLTVGQLYEVIPEKDINPKNGVNGTDIALIRRKILGIEDFATPYQHIAADVNNSGSINGTDIALIRSLILGLSDNFANNTSWRFIPASYNFQNPDNPLLESFPESLTYNPIQSSLENQDFIGTKIGDVNQSANPLQLVNNNSGSTIKPTSNIENLGNLSLFASSAEAVAGETVTIEFSVEDFNEIIVFEFSIGWDATILEIVDSPFDYHPIFNGVLNFNINSAEGKLGVAWDDATLSGQMIPNGEVLFKIDFLVIGEPNECSLVEFTNDPTVMNVTDVNFEEFDIIGNSGTVKVIEVIEELTVEETITDLNCFGDTNGSISLQITGGSGDFSIQWNSGQTTSTINNLPTGNYAATITDNATNETITTGNIAITSPPEITLTTSSSPEVDGNNDGTATANASGGTPPFNYQWNDPQSQTTSVATQLSAGNYQVIVTDANGCTNASNVTVSEETTTSGPSNDECDEAINISNLFGQPVEITQTSSTFNNEGATASNDVPVVDPYCLTDTGFENSVWFSFEGDGNTYLIETTGCNSNNEIEDTQLVLYEGANCATQTEIACNDDADFDFYSSIMIETTNQPYFILIDGYEAAAGDFCIEVTQLLVDNINDVANNGEIEVFPNPANNYIFIQHSAEKPFSNPKIQLFDISGKLVFSEQHSNWQQNRMEIDFDLPNGTYLLKIESNENNFHQRLIIQK